MIAILSRALPLPWRPFCAKLAGVNGFTGRGSAFFQYSGDGDRKLSVELFGVAGCEANVAVNDDAVATVSLVNGRANATFTSKRGDKLPKLYDDARIDIRQNGDVILSGVLSRT